MTYDSNEYIITNVNYEYGEQGKIERIVVTWVKRLNGTPFQQVYSSEDAIKQVGEILQQQNANTAT